MMVVMMKTMKNGMINFVMLVIFQSSVSTIPSCFL